MTFEPEKYPITEILFYNQGKIMLCLCAGEGQHFIVLCANDGEYWYARVSPEKYEILKGASLENPEINKAFIGKSVYVIQTENNERVDITRRTITKEDFWYGD